MAIDLSRNKLSGDIPTTIKGLKNLQFIYLLTSSTQSFSDLISLNSLDLSNNIFARVIPVLLEKLVYLEYLNLSSNNLEREIPTGDLL
ncbi:hypothetical protein CUMW_136270 [Citrus unshiu]|nr:hypothetical protein CUMW_136270 [Citrus unshiu]